MVAVEPMRVGRQDREAPEGDLPAVQVRGRRWDAHGRVGGVAVAGWGDPLRAGVGWIKRIGMMGVWVEADVLDFAGR